VPERRCPRAVPAVQIPFWAAHAARAPPLPQPVWEAHPTFCM